MRIGVQDLRHAVVWWTLSILSEPELLAKAHPQKQQRAMAVRCDTMRRHSSYIRVTESNITLRDEAGKRASPPREAGVKGLSSDACVCVL